MMNGMGKKTLGLCRSSACVQGPWLAMFQLWVFPPALEGLLRVEEKERREDSFRVAPPELVNLELSGGRDVKATQGRKAHQLIGKRLQVCLAWPGWEKIGFLVNKQVPSAASKPQSFINRGLLFPHVPVTYQAFITLILQSGC